MARISLVEQYDNKDVIQQIYKLKTATDGWEERISASEQASNEALTKADGFDERIQEVADAQADVDNKIEGFDTRIATANQTADNAVAKVDTLDRQVDTRIADQEVKGLSVASAGTGAYAVTAVKQNGNVTSNSFNVSKVTSATIGEGEAQNSIYLQLNLSDGTTVRTNDTVISITGVEEDIHVTSIVLEDAPDAHTIKAIFTYNNGQSISSNTLTYDYPDIASSSSPGLVMGNDATGGVQVDGQGRMTVVGWDTFATQDALEALEDEVGAVGQAGTIRNDLDILNKLTAFYGNRAVLNDVGTTGYQTDTDNPNLVKYGFQYTKAYKDGTAVKNEIVDDYFIPIYSNKLVGGGDKATLYSTKYIDGLETTLQGGIDAVDARCDNISSTVSDHGTMLNAQAEAIQANTTAIAGKQDAGDYATNTALTEGLATKQDKLVLGENVDRYPDATSGRPVASSGVYEKCPFAFRLGSDGVTATVTPDSDGNATVTFRHRDWTSVLPDRVSRQSTYTYLHLAFAPAGGTQYPTITGMTASLEWTTGYLDVTLKLANAVSGTMSMGTQLYMLAFHDGVDANRDYHMGTIGVSYMDIPVAMIEASAGSDSILCGCDWTAPVGSTGGSVIVDTAISASSTNPVQNKVISAALDTKASTATTDALTQELAGKQDKLTAGTGISIVDGVISVNLSNANGVSF